jgi:hypothetical protein
MIASSDKIDITSVEAEMISAIGRSVPRSGGILHWLRQAFRWGKRPRLLRADDLPEDLRRDVGLEPESHVRRDREIAGQRFLDLTRPGAM